MKRLAVRHNLVPDWFVTMHLRKEHSSWEARGKTPPSSSRFKQQLVRNYAAEHNLRVLIESGTYFGSMVSACLHDFDSIYSIELQESFYLRARRKFRAHSHVTVVCGNSATELARILERVDQPCLFWLDAHYSGGLTARGPLETPIIKELEAVFAHSAANHHILIDDARCFDATHDYPALQEVADYAAAHHYSCTMRDDVIRLVKSSAHSQDTL
jgi:hypothetical protein